MGCEIIEILVSGGPTVEATNNSSVVEVSSSICGSSSFDSSLYYLNSNPSGFITAAQGGGVLTINGLSGLLNLTGINNQIFVSGQYIFISGVSGASTSQFIGNYVSGISVTGFPPYTGLVNISGLGNINVLTGINNSIFISGDILTLSGFLQNQIYNSGVNFYNNLNLVSGNIQSTGNTLYNLTTSLSGAEDLKLQSTGQNLYSYIVSLSGSEDIKIQNTGQSLQSQITLLNNATGYINTNPSGFISGFNSGQYATTINLASTGSILYTYVNNLSGNFDTRLYDTGSNLLSLISAASAGVSSINGTSGVISFTGRNGIFVVSGGIGNIVISGNFPSSGDIQNTGSNLQNSINLISGNLVITGQTLYNYLTSLSGAEDIKINNINNLSGSFYPYNNPSNFANSGNIQNTGQTLYNLITNYTGYNNTNPSGYITNTQTGQFYPSTNPQNYSSSGNVQNTGANLYAYIVSLSGAEDIKINNINNLTGTFYPYNNPSNFANSGNLQSSGQTLYNYIVNTSGNLDTRLYQTGQTLIGLINASAGGVSSVNGASGILNITGTGNVIVISGGVGIIYLSGNSNDGINLSGNLTSTGQILYGYITNASGNLDARIYQTGSNLYTLINNFSGIFNNSGIQYQTQINSLIANVQSTGSTLDSKTNSLSGWMNGLSKVFSISVTGFLGQTGNISVSGLGIITVHTGNNNFIYISGNNNDGINLSGFLTTTGQTLYNYINNLSGVLDSTISNLYQTGSNLYNLINNFSGIFNNSGIQYQNQINTLITNIQSTGISLKNTIDLISGNIQTTGSNNSNRITLLSGYLDNIPKITGFAITGGNNLTGLLSINAGANISLTQIGNNTVSIAATAGGGGGGAAITGISVSGSNYFSGNNGQINISGSGSVGVVLNGQNNIIFNTNVSTWSNLIWDVITNWDTVPNVYEEKKILYMTGNTTLSINNLYNGWQGILQTIQSGNSVSGYILTLPANTKVVNSGVGKMYLTSGSGARDMIAFSYDGSILFGALARTFN